MRARGGTARLPHLKMAKAQLELIGYFTQKHEVLPTIWTVTIFFQVETFRQKERKSRRPFRRWFLSAVVRVSLYTAGGGIFQGS
jgi:hypothetical protein